MTNPTKKVNVSLPSFSSNLREEEGWRGCRRALEFLHSLIAQYFFMSQSQYLILLCPLFFLFFRNLSVRFVGTTTATGDLGLSRGISKNGAISMVCNASVFRTPRTLMKSPILWYVMFFQILCSDFVLSASSADMWFFHDRACVPLVFTTGGIMSTSSKRWLEFCHPI